MLVDQLLNLTAEDDNIDFQIEFLSLLVQEGNRDSFCRVLKAILDLLEIEEEFHDVLALCEDYFHCLDEEGDESKIRAIIDRREGIDPETAVDSSDQDLKDLRQIFQI